MTPDDGGSPAEQPLDAVISIPEAPAGAAPSAEASALRGRLGQLQLEQLQLLLLRHAQRCTRYRRARWYKPIPEGTQPMRGKGLDAVREAPVSVEDNRWGS